MANYNTEEMLKKGKDFAQQQGSEYLKKGAQEVKESGKDWWNYVENHPIQSMIFGVVGYFALKGMFKS